MPKYDIEEVKSAAFGRHEEILSFLCGVPVSILDGEHYPCPKCGGNKRFNMSRDGSGKAYCNDCPGGPTVSSNIVGTVAWLTDTDYRDAKEVVAKYLGVEPIGNRSTKANSKPAQSPPAPKPPQPAKKLSDPELCHEVYTKLAETFGINEKHRRDLHQRGLTDEEITYRGYWSAPGKGIDSIRLAQLFPDRSTIAEKVPGVFPGGAIKVNATDALMIPMRSPDGKIVGIQYRLDKPTKSGEKYLWLSSKSAGGPSSGAPAHTALPPRGDHDATRLRITEGPLKADIATFLSGIRTVGAGGANNWKSMIEPVEQINPGQVILSFDKDAETNAGVAKSAVKAYDHFVAGQSLVYVEDWPETQKGIDDALLHLKNEVKILELEAGAKKIDNLRRFVDEDESHEHPDDPHRLARVNLEQYKEKGRTLRYWKGAWYSYKGTHYVEIDNDYLKARVADSIKREFDRLREEEHAKYLAWKRSPDYDNRKDKGPPKTRKVNDSITSNVMLATKSICVLSSSIAMPCWLPDRSEPHYVAAKNGILDLDAIFDDREDVLLPHTPDWFSRFRLDYPFEPSSKCPLWMRFLTSAMEGDHERMAVLQEWAGYLLTNKNYLQRFLVLEGDGSNGKTVFFSGITAMLGNENVSHVALEKFSGQFDMMTTIGKSANICGDVGEIDKVAEAELKQFTGGDVMQFDRKNRDPLAIQPTAKLMMSWNRRPSFRDRSNGLWRRMLIVPFDYKPSKEEIIRGMDNSKWWIENGEAPGILNWAIAGLHRLREQGDFTLSQKHVESIRDFKLTANPALDFLESFIDYCDGGKIIKQDLYEQYKKFCFDLGVRFPLSQRKFGKEVTAKFPKVKDSKISVSGDGRKNCYLGIGYTTVPDESGF